MRYIASIIPADVAGTIAALLHTAADIVATNPASVNAIAEAAIATGYTGDTHAAEAVPIKIASRHRAVRAQIHPLDQKHWRFWQAIIDEPWPILADAAGIFTEPCDGIEPGRWEL